MQAKWNSRTAPDAGFDFRRYACPRQWPTVLAVALTIALFLCSAWALYLVIE